MATYNGSKFLAAQIDSIIAQTNQEWTLYIQDDGSKDDTLEIIRDYSLKDERIVLVELGLTHQGCCNNFMTLLNVVESDYYMFSDQDDVWLPEKIDVSLVALLENEKENPERPILVFTDRILVNEKLDYIQNGNPMWNSRLRLSEEECQRYVDTMFELNMLYLICIAGGNTMIFNHAAKSVSTHYLNIRVHDSNLLINVKKNDGIIVPLLTPTLLYRSHSSQVCGVTQTSLLKKVTALSRVIKSNARMFYIWKVYCEQSFIKFLYYRLKMFFILRFKLGIG